MVGGGERTAPKNHPELIRQITLLAQPKKHSVPCHYQRVSNLTLTFTHFMSSLEIESRAPYFLVMR